MASQYPVTDRFRGGVEIALLLSLLIIAVLLAILWKMIDEPPPPLPIPDPPVACGNQFLGTDDFSGSWTPQNVTSYALGASSEFNGTILLANVDSDLVEAILPVNWSLAKPLDSAESCHPVLILYGEQSNLKVIIGNSGNSPGGADPYTEMMLLIPFTQRDLAGPLWHTAVIKMYLNNATAIVIGNSTYAYAKESATFTDTGSVFTVYPGFVAAFEATSSSPGSWQDFSVSNLPNLGQITDILGMPLVGIEKYQWAVGGELDVCSYFDMVYVNDGIEARVRSVHTQHDYFSNFVPAMANWIGLPPLSNSTDGAIEIENMGWKLMFPALSHCKYN